MKHVYAFLLGLFLVPSALATHIVGGELDLQPVTSTSGATHRLNLNLYFDAVNGNPGAEDFTVIVSIFRKRDNFLMGNVELVRVSNEFITYTNPACVTVTGLRTRLIQYSSLVIFQASSFNDPPGYYIVWERCCRNNVISNIRQPGSSGSVFYLEIPPLQVNGRAFKNGSPQFTPVLGDYVCRGEPFTFDFSATDPDRDSLQYSLVTPYNGFSTPQEPKIQARGSSNYPEVSWGTSYSASNSIPGNPALRIDARTGRLTVTASELGLFVFSVLVQESRNGQRIGLVRRDFQLKVIDCPQNTPPKVQLREAGKTDFYREGQTIRIKRGEEKCLTFLITDPDVRQRETITLKPVKGALSYTFLPREAIIRTASDTIRAKLCLGECAQSFDGQPIVFDVISTDDGCPLSRSSSLRISVFIEPDPNAKPTVATTLPGNTAKPPLNTPLTFNVNGVDIDNDSLVLEAKGRGFNLAAVGMEFTNASGRGKLSQPFKWTPRCGSVGPYIVDFYVIDTRCGRHLRDSVSVTLSTQLPDNQAPTVATTLTNNVAEITLEAGTPQAIRFNVNATDPDGKPLSLTGVGRGFDMKTAGMQFENKSGGGPLTSPFTWTPACGLLQGKTSRTFIVNFTADDNACVTNRLDTLSVRLTLVDRPVNYDFKPPNVFSPNGDGKNDFYAIETLPVDNCAERFERIVIYNRWGTEVFQDTNREFRWYGTDYASGEYFYHIEYTQRRFKGPLTLLK
ncbi:MAG: gliding motility-associated C-terminal domain-containing protein [Cytophagaceae bacterium]|nr:gliding motility-associated C-terminal domain-containing protein [Cytophagaceae bacterium]